ncbi:hypothetical protein BH11PLA2_BH11PLA2_02130 [soil metagenome]
MTGKGPLLIVGASGRAAAAAMFLEGFTPFVIDLFADADTQRLARTLKCELRDYPQGFIKLSETLPPMPWMYTGGLENYPDVVETISRRHKLLGNPPAVLNRVRDPYQLAAAIQQHRGQCPMSYPVHPGGNGKYIRKPYRSAGGHSISFKTENSPDHYFQDYIEGTQVSAAFDGNHCILMTRQLIGEDWLHAPSFHYCGNISIPSDDALLSIYPFFNETQFANALELRGSWGLDGIANSDGVWILEVNPRYCASHELQRHLFESLNDSIGKAIYYAPKPMIFPKLALWRNALKSCTNMDQRPEYADIPETGTSFEPGQPVITLFATAPRMDDCLLQLKARAAELDRLFGVTP